MALRPILRKGPCWRIGEKGGSIAAFLRKLQTKKHPLRCLIEVVAGAGFEPTTFGL